jgi:IclR family pca regulon transcriptional regulator
MGRTMLAHLPREQVVDILKRSNLRKYTPKTITDEAALLREIEKVRAQGYSIIDQELEKGLISIAVPVRTRSSKIACAINVGARSDANSSSKLIKNVLPLLRAGAERLERILI